MATHRDPPSGRGSGGSSSGRGPSDGGLGPGPVKIRLLRTAAWLLAIACFVWAIQDPLFRDDEGFLAAQFCLPLAGSVALALLGSGAGRSWQRSSLWLALAVLGQAVSLQLIDAGPHVRYQHYGFLTRGFELYDAWLLAAVGLQASLVYWGFRGRGSEIRAGLTRSFGIWPLAGITLVFIGSAATLWRDVEIYIGELMFASAVQALNLATITLAILAVPEGLVPSIKRWLDRLLGKEELGPGEGPLLDRFVLVAAAWTLVLSAALCLFSYQRHPHVPDEVAYLFHARYLAEGLLSMPAPPVPSAFNVDLMYYEAGRWFSPVPPGWPAVLSLGALLGAAWLVNPLLAGLNIVLTYAFLRELYARRSARLAVLLLCLSPWFVFMGMNFMTHTSTLTAALIAAIGTARLNKTGRLRWAGVSGIAIGLVSLIRPLEAVALAGLLGLWALWGGRRRLFGLARVSAMAVSAAIVGGIGLVYNARLMGDPTRFPIMAYTDEYYAPGTNDLGFGPDRGLGWTGLDPFPGHGLADVLVNANLNTFAVNVELFGWSAGSLFLIAVLLFAGRVRKEDGLMLAAIAAVVGIHSFYWFSGGPDFGARYWFLIIVPCAILTVRGLESLERRFGAWKGFPGTVGARLEIGVLFLCFSAIATFFPWRAVDKYHHYRGMRPDIRQLAQRHEFGRSLVLIRGERHPDYASAAIYNPLDPQAPAPVYVWDRSDSVRADVLEAYGDRPVWVVAGPSVTGAGFRVIRGPLRAEGDGRAGTVDSSMRP